MADDDDPVVLRPGGDLDLATSAPALDGWRRTIDDQRPARVIVDLGAVTFLDSSGLSALVSLRKRVIEYGGTCLLRGASTQQQRLLTMTGLAQLFPDATLPLDG